MKSLLGARPVALLAVFALIVGCAVNPNAEGGGEPFVCENAQPVLQPDSGLPSGFVQCDGGFIHRAEKIDPSDPRGPDVEDCASENGGECQTGADCIDLDHGRCVHGSWGQCSCSYGCASDAECEEGFICAPAGVAGARSTCIQADCTRDDECGDGVCGLSSYDHCCGTNYVMGCAYPDQPCHVDTQCGSAPCIGADGEGSPWQCSYTSVHTPDDDQWTCEPPGWCECSC